MALELVRLNGSPYWRLRGELLGVTVDEMTKDTDRNHAECTRVERESGICQEWLARGSVEDAKYRIKKALSGHRP